MAINQQYNWKRFWCPRGGSIFLTKEGYLNDWGKYNKGIVTFDSIMNLPCLILLGEPGMGKSNVLKSEWQHSIVSIEKDGNKTLSIDLRSFGSEDRLVGSIFGCKEFIEWVNGNHHLHIFLDSLDECLLRIDTVATLLVDELKKYPVQRLSLRIACRSAEWPAVLENGLRELWSDAAIGIYELAPLRQQDVIEAARTEGIEAIELFLGEITRKNAGPLAAKPVTLKLLLNLWLKNQHLPETQAELYEQGCLLLCEEESPSRIAARLKGKFPPTERMVVAARIAAVTVFANRFAIWIDVDRGNCPEEDITVRELCGYTEHTTVGSFTVTEEAVRETIEATGLFSLRGTNRLGWVHQTYAEFLAAWYLKHLKLDVTKVISLITHLEDAEGKIAPQLHEVSAWIAGMMPEVFTHLMKTDTMVLLRSDVASADTSAKSQLTAALLELFAGEKEFDHWEIRNQYHKLKHPDLANQLYPYINDSNQRIIVRRVAIDITKECKVTELQNELANIALNENENLAIRKQAAAAVSEIGDSDTRLRLKPLALGMAGDDPDDELRGAGLIAVWPDYLSAEELFSTLPKPDEWFHGLYGIFLSRHLKSHLKPAQLPIALRWIETLGSRRNLGYSFERIVDEILVIAWKYLNEPGVLEAFAEVTLQRLKAYEEIVEDHYPDECLKEFVGDDEKRYLVLKVLFPHANNPDDDWVWFTHSSVISVFSKDIPWLLESLQDAHEPTEQLLLARLIDRVLGYGEVQPEILSALQTVCNIHPLLNAILSQRFKVIELDSPEAAKMREVEKQMQKRQKRRESEENQEPLLEPPPAERIARLLAKFEKGDFDAWWSLNQEMTLEPHSTHYGSELEADLMKLPGWEKADSQTRERIIAAAKKYLLQGDPNTSKWQGTNILYRPAFAGYRSLLLLLQIDSDFISGLAESIWRKWIPIIVAYPTSSGLDSQEEVLHRKITTLAYKKAPDAVIQCLLFDLDKANSDGGYVHIQDKFDECWDSQMKDALRGKIQEQNLRSELYANILGQLLEHGDSQTKEYAESLLDSQPLSDDEHKKLALILARELLRYCSETCWGKIWLIIKHNTEFGRDLIESLAGGSGKITTKLPEEAQADLYIWLAQQYPHREDPDTRGAHFIGTRESVGRWRDSILNQLKGLGTPQSLIAIEAIQRELPELDWMKWVLNEAKDNLRRHTWIPLQPQQIILLGQNDLLPTSQEQSVVSMNTEELSRASLFWNSKLIKENSVLMEFLNLYKNTPDRVVPFVGAGLSLPLFPGWRKLLEEMVKKCADLGKLVYDSDELLRKIDQGISFLDIAECCVGAFGGTGYRDFIQEHYDKDFTYERIPPAYRELLNLDFRTILTTNYDRIPEVGGKGKYRIFTHQTAAEARRARVEEKEVVMKLHGDVSNQSSIILTRSDYDQIIFLAPDIRNFLQGILETKTLLFIGFGLSDPHLDHLLSGLKSICSGIPLTHYALLTGLTDFEANAKEKNFGIKIIRYEPSDASHPEVLDFIRLLAQD